MSVKFNKSYWYFVFSRFLGVLVKPAFLYYFLHKNMESESNLLALVYLFLAGVFVILSIPAHYDFYKSFFERRLKHIQMRSVVQGYLSKIISHVFLVLPILMAAVFLIFDEIYTAILVFSLLLSEKLFDEVQRFLLFDKKFTIWSNIFLLKTLVPLILSFALGYVFSFENNHVLLFFAITIGLNVFIFIYMLPKYIYLLIRRAFSSFKKNVYNYIIDLKKGFVLRYFQGIFHTNALQVDKWVLSMHNYSTLFSELTLMSQLSNGINIAGNYIFISNRRSELLNSNSNLNSLWIGIKVPLISIFLFCSLLITMFVLINMQLIEFNQLPILSIILIACTYTICTITEPISENLFWRVDLNELIKTELIHIVFSATLGYLIVVFYSPYYISIALFLGISLRLGLQLRLIKKYEH